MDSNSTIADFIKVSGTIEKSIDRLNKLSINIPTMQGSASMNSHVGAPIDIRFRAIAENCKMIDSNYFFNICDTNNSKLIHFTHIEALESILDEKAIRMYNLNNSNDKTEYNFVFDEIRHAYKLFTIPDVIYQNHINYVKSNTFILSTALPSDMFNPTLWKRYGRKGFGIVLELEVLNNPIDWQCFLLSKVQYHLDKFSVYINGLKRIYFKYFSRIQNINLGQLLFWALHKNPEDWKKENEIRILTAPPIDEIWQGMNYTFNHVKAHNDLIKPDEQKNNQKVKYFELPLYYDNENNKTLTFFNKLMPKMKISNIYGGPFVDSKEIDRLLEKFNLSKRIVFNKLDKTG